MKKRNECELPQAETGAYQAMVAIADFGLLMENGSPVEGRWNFLVQAGSVWDLNI